MEVAGLSRRTSDLLTSFLPNAQDTALLRAALLDGAAAADAWQEWLARVVDPVQTLGTDRRHIKVLVPLLAENLRSAGVVLPPAFATYARAAHLTETLRMTAFRRECARALDLLAVAGIEPVVLKGAAFADVLYASPALRHTHDFDLLVPESDLLPAARALLASDFTANGTLDTGHHHLRPLKSTRGLMVELHRRPSFLYEQYDGQGAINRSVPATVAGRLVRAMSIPDAFAFVCAHAVTCMSASNLQWVGDATLLARTMTAAHWQEMVAIAARSNMALPLAITMGYLKTELGMNVPASTMAAINEAASRTDRRGRSAAIFGVRRSLPLGLAELMREPLGWRLRLSQLGWRLAPPPQHIRWTYRVKQGWRVPLYYPYRLMKLVGRRR